MSLTMLCKYRKCGPDFWVAFIFILVNAPNQRTAKTTQQQVCGIKGVGDKMLRKKYLHTLRLLINTIHGKEVTILSSHRVIIYQPSPGLVIPLERALSYPSWEVKGEVTILSSQGVKIPQFSPKGSRS